MSELLRDQKFAEIQQQADRERARVEYITGLIDDNWTEVFMAFLPTDTPVDELAKVSEEEAREKVAEILYDRVSKNLDYLAGRFTAPIGVTIYQRVIGSTADLPGCVRIGWASMDPCWAPEPDHPADKLFPHSIHVTQHGRDVINGLRAVQGYETIEAQYARQRKAWDDAKESLNREIEEEDFVESATSDQNVPAGGPA